MGLIIMRVFFRADANTEIGMGHIMRCLSVADVFDYYGYDIYFLTADDRISELITGRGYEVIVLHSDYKLMDKEEWSISLKPDIVFVDSYYVTEMYLKTIKSRINSYGGKLIYIDDVCAFPYPVDILVNYNIYASASFYSILYGQTDGMPDLILGLDYVPLRSMFKNIPKKKQIRKINNVLISTGGSDNLHLSLAILRYVIEISSTTDSNRIYHFLLGNMNLDKNEIKMIASAYKNIVVHENVTDMKSLIYSSDIVVAAAGSTLYEIAACGIPLVVYSMADNQIPGAEAFERMGIGFNVGDIRHLSSCITNCDMSDTLIVVATRIMNEVEKLSDDYQCRCRMATLMQKLIDGQGAERLVKKIMELIRNSYN